LGSIPGYTLSLSILQDLTDFLDDLDQAWLAVLQSQLWDPDRAEGVDLLIPLDPPTQAYQSSPPSQTDTTRLRSMLFSGQSALEEWISNQRNTLQGDDDGLDDVSFMLAKLGLLDQFDSIFARTLDYLGGFSGDVARNVVDPEMEIEMS
jgi:hypothetical protein